jgi:hypothetical protein
VCSYVSVYRLVITDLCNLLQSRAAGFLDAGHGKDCRSIAQQQAWGTVRHRQWHQHCTGESLCSDRGKGLSSESHILQLALKHRENKSLRQRILVFVGSPLPDEEAELVKLGKKLKKNNVAVDVVNFGETEENLAKLNAFIESVNSGENSCVG